MQSIWHVPWVDRLRSRYGVLEGNACCAVEQFLCQSDEDCVWLHIQTHAECQPATQTPSAALLLSLSSFHLCHSVFRFLLLIFFFPLLSPLLCLLPLSPSPFIALPLSLYLCVFSQSDTGAQRFSPTHHCDSHNCLTRENKFHSKSRNGLSLFFSGLFFFFSNFFFPFVFWGSWGS